MRGRGRARGDDGRYAPPILRDEKADGRFWLIVRQAAMEGSFRPSARVECYRAKGSLRLSGSLWWARRRGVRRDAVVGRARVGLGWLRCRVAGRKLEAVVDGRVCGLGAREHHGRGLGRGTAVKRERVGIELQRRRGDSRSVEAGWK
jgi:hypothetical protein